MSHLRDYLKKAFSAVQKCKGALLKKVKAIFAALLFSSFGFVFINPSESIDSILNHVVNQKDTPEANAVSVQNGKIVLEKVSSSNRVPSYSAKKNTSVPPMILT